MESKSGVNEENEGEWAPSAEELAKVTLGYHAKCLDGLGAAWAAKRGLLWDDPNMDLTVVPVSYREGQLSELMDINPVGRWYLVDFAIPPSKALGYKSDPTVVMIDHHATSAPWAEELKANPKWRTNVTMIHDQAKSGAILAWEYWHLGEDAPWPLAYIQDRDLWKFELPDSKVVNAGIRALNTDLTPEGFEQFMDLALSKGIDYVKSIGEGAILNVRAICKEAVSKSFWTLIQGQPAIATFATDEISEVGAALLAAHPGAAFAAVVIPGWDALGDRPKYHMSLRSEDSRSDVEAVAKAFGGGGHRNAAGFQVSKFQNVLVGREKKPDA